eukprot:scaffold129929_cov57-Phaeocystis_antarctica.AAC.1
MRHPRLLLRIIPLAREVDADQRRAVGPREDQGAAYVHVAQHDLDVLRAPAVEGEAAVLVPLDLGIAVKREAAIVASLRSVAPGVSTSQGAGRVGCRCPASHPEGPLECATSRCGPSSCPSPVLAARASSVQSLTAGVRRLLCAAPGSADARRCAPCAAVRREVVSTLFTSCLGARRGVRVVSKVETLGLYPSYETRCQDR